MSECPKQSAKELIRGHDQALNEAYEAVDATSKPRTEGWSPAAHTVIGAVAAVTLIDMADRVKAVLTEGT